MPDATRRRPEVFISATSGDLRTCRQLVKESLLTLGCTPVEQTNFPPSATTVREMLRQKLHASDAVVHIAGVHYGAEPVECSPGEPRRSYTQLEYDLARELRKPVYVFICGADFPYDPAPPEDDEKRGLQLAHRARLQSGDHLFTPIADRTELTLRVHALQTKVEHLAGELQKSRSWLARGLSAGLALALLLGAGLWFLHQRSSRTASISAAIKAQADATDTKVAKLETELEAQRRYIKTVADAFTAQKSELDRLKIPEAEQFTRAVAAVAAQNNLPAAELQSVIDLFVAAVSVDPKSDFMDRALAEFAGKNFAAAAQNASSAATAAEQKLQSLSQLETRLAQERIETSTRLRQARHMEGQSLYSNRDYAGSVSAFRSALTATTRSEQPLEWAQFQFSLGLALYKQSQQSEGIAVSELGNQSVAALEMALEVRTRATLPVEWATTHHHLGVTLRAQASSSVGENRTRLLHRAEAEYRAALQVRTREQDPIGWADTMNALAIVLRNQTSSLAGAEQAPPPRRNYCDLLHGARNARQRILAAGMGRNPE